MTNSELVSSSFRRHGPILECPTTAVPLTLAAVTFKTYYIAWTYSPLNARISMIGFRHEQTYPCSVSGSESAIGYQR